MKAAIVTECMKSGEFLNETYKLNETRKSDGGIIRGECSITRGVGVNCDTSITLRDHFCVTKSPQTGEQK